MFIQDAGRLDLTSGVRVRLVYKLNTDMPTATVVSKLSMTFI